MNVQIEKLLLHRRNWNDVKIYDFKTGVINLISGINSRGKTSFIKAVDFALCSKDCKIDKRVKRAVDYVGLILKIGKTRHLFARHIPYGDDKGFLCYHADLNATDDGFTVENFTKENGVSYQKMLPILNRLVGADIAESMPSSGKTTPLSIRSLMNVVLQDYTTIASEQILFRNQADGYSKAPLVSWLPYVFGVRSEARMRAEIERDDANARYRRLLNEISRAYRLSEQWMAELDGEIQNCRKLGLVLADDKMGPGLSGKVELLHTIRNRALDTYAVDPDVKASDEDLGDMLKLQKEQANISVDLQEVQTRIDSLLACAEEVRDVTSDVRRLESRLKLAEWLGVVWSDAGKRDLFMLALGSTAEELNDEMEKLYGALKDYQDSLINTKKQTDFKTAVKRELKALYERRQKLEAKHRNITARVKDRMRREARAKEYLASQRAAFMQLGRIEKVITLAESMVDRNPNNDAELMDLKSQADLADNRAKAEERAEEQRLSVFERSFGEILTNRVRELDAEKDIVQAHAFFDLSRLDIKLLFPNREDWLSEHGSSHNHIAYHIAITEAIQEYVSRVELSPLPSFVFYDQPTQSNNDRPGLVLDKVFESLERSVDASKNIENPEGWQPIVIDYVSQEKREKLDKDKYHVVADLEGVDGFVPTEWLKED